MPIPATDALARRNALVFAMAQAFGGATNSIVVAAGGLVGLYLTGSEALATLPVTTSHVGVAAFTLPVAFLARRVGRRASSVASALVGALAGAFAAYAIIQNSFALFCLATFFAGASVASMQQYRFAAADMATPAFKARAISWVMAGGVFAAIIGPQTSIWTRDLLAPIPFAGVFVGHAALWLLCALALTRLIDVEPAATSVSGSGPARPLGEIFRQPRLIAAIVCGLVSYGLMSFAMTAAPMAIVACGYSSTIAWLGIQWHVLGMFAPSFYTGKLIDRFGAERITAVGLALLAASALVALMGIEIAHFWTSLILLGLGWNFSFIGATALVTQCYRPSERASVQAINDFSIFGTVAVASLASGQVLNAGGWSVINWVMLPLLGVAALALAGAHAMKARAA